MIEYNDLSPSEKNIYDHCDFLLLRFDKEEKINILTALLNKYKVVK